MAESELEYGKNYFVAGSESKNDLVNSQRNAAKLPNTKVSKQLYTQQEKHVWRFRNSIIHCFYIM